MTSTTSPTGHSDYLQELATIREDPQVKRLALRWAGSPDVAEDALQETYYVMARISDPYRIKDLRAYFCRTLRHEIYRLRGQFRAVLVEDFAGLADIYEGKAAGTTFDAAVCDDLQAQAWLDLFTAQRDALTRPVPGRSPDPAHYREAIVTVAGSLLRSIARRDVSDADRDQALIAVYPEWFAAEGLTTDNAYQRFSRARADIRRLVQTIVKPDDLCQ